MDLLNKTTIILILLLLSACSSLEYSHYSCQPDNQPVVSRCLGRKYTASDQNWAFKNYNKSCERHGQKINPTHFYESFSLGATDYCQNQHVAFYDTYQKGVRSSCLENEDSKIQIAAQAGREAANLDKEIETLEEEIANGRGKNQSLLRGLTDYIFNSSREQKLARAQSKRQKLFSKYSRSAPQRELTQTTRLLNNISENLTGRPAPISKDIRTSESMRLEWRDLARCRDLELSHALLYD
ncbi:MAG: hypothetical protein AAF203_04345 [Pseudomonadota bacterium]